jgi:hypothetical protein
MIGGKVPHKHEDTRLIVSGSLHTSDALSIGTEPLEPTEWENGWALELLTDVSGKIFLIMCKVYSS